METSKNGKEKEDRLFFRELGGDLQAHELFNKSWRRGQSLGRVWGRVRYGSSWICTYVPPRYHTLNRSLPHR